jgi:hypothetical protein
MRIWLGGLDQRLGFLSAALGRHLCNRRMTAEMLARRSGSANPKKDARSLAGLDWTHITAVSGWKLKTTVAAGLRKALGTRRLLTAVLLIAGCASKTVEQVDKSGFNPGHEDVAVVGTPFVWPETGSTERSQRWQGILFGGMHSGFTRGWDYRRAVGTMTAGAICRPALVAAEARHDIPSGLLQAIGLVESDRRDAATGRREPWPWTINAEGEPHFFETKQQAVDWVRDAQARGVRSIDVGCAQINLMYHPTAFASLEQAFDPGSNADYAARFLKELRNTTAGGTWMTAAGDYHSQTPELAEPYRQQAAMADGTLAPTPVHAL